MGDGCASVAQKAETAEMVGLAGTARTEETAESENCLILRCNKIPTFVAARLSEGNSGGVRHFTELPWLLGRPPAD